MYVSGGIGWIGRLTEVTEKDGHNLYKLGESKKEVFVGK